jgi:hypothetical protein
VKNKKNPRGEPGVKGHRHEHLSEECRSEREPTSPPHDAPACLRCLIGNSSRISTLTLLERLLPLLTSNSGEGFLKIRINASRVTKESSGIDFIDVSQSCLCHTNVFVSMSSKMRSGFEEVALVQRLAQVAILRKACDCKAARHTYPGCRYYTL